MKDNKRTANIVDGNKMLCRTCNEFRELRYFRRSQVDNKCYYTTKKCKVCLGITINENKYENDQYIKPVQSKLSDECLLFLERMKLVRGYIDMIDCYKLAHHYTDFFGYRDVFYESMEDELTFMLVELLKQKKKEENEYKIS